MIKTSFFDPSNKHFYVFDYKMPLMEIDVLVKRPRPAADDNKERN